MKRFASDDANEEGRGLILAGRSGKEATLQPSLEGMNSDKVMSRLQIVQLTGLLGVALTVAALTVTALTVAAPTVAHASDVPTCFGLLPTNTPTAGNDVIVGTAGPDVLAGGAGDDQISGLQGDDRLCGNEGNDKVRGNAGNTDRIDGGLGDDLLGGGEYLPGGFGYPDCELNSGSAGEQSPADSPVFNTIYGGPGVDRILGGGGVDTMKGGDGHDCLEGIDGDDKLWGESGADYISAGPGSDVAVGGNDYDDIYGGGINPDFNDGSDLLYAGSTNVQLPLWPQTCRQNGEFAFEAGPVETGEASVLDNKNFLSGDQGYDILVGTNRTDEMHGGPRGDDLYGFGGTDDLYGGTASDCLSGGPEHDFLYDADPNNLEPDDKDTLWGGGASDFLNAKDGDSYDSLNGGEGISEPCIYDPGDVVNAC
jgi:Ca2+-binding RTX toxin-like protein